MSQYLYDTLYGLDVLPSVGALDMGGASTQITYVPGEKGFALFLDETLPNPEKALDLILDLHLVNVIAIPFLRDLWTLHLRSLQ